MPSSEMLPVSKIKVRIPSHRRELITRTRLIESLHEQLEKQLLMIVAPAGYGKTSLLVDFAHNSELPVCWLSLDVLDQEPQRFLTYLIGAIAEKYPEFGSDSLSAVTSLTSFEQDGERMLVTLTNEIATKVDEHFVLILDDYHLVGDVLIIRQLINRLLQLAGENFHLILATRNLPDFPDMPLLIIRNLVGGLSFDELAFQPLEIQQLYEQNFQKKLSVQDAESLVKETEGWVAAIQLSGVRARGQSRVSPVRSNRELFDFFAREILSHQTEEVQRFLLMTSFFDAFDISLCKEVLSPLVDDNEIDWESLFATVQAGSMFSVSVDDEGQWIRYHHLFQHFLRSKLRYDDPVMAWHVQQNLAIAYEKRMAWEEALQVYANLDDHENLARLLARSGSVFVSSGRILTLSSWLNRLPDETIYSIPELISLLGVVHASRGETAQAVELYNQVEEKLHGAESSEEWAVTLVRRAEAYRQLGQFTLALEDTEKTFETTEKSPSALMKKTYAEAQRIKGLSLYGLGDLKQALSWLKTSLRTCREVGMASTIPILETELGVVYRRLGEIDTAAKHYASALRAWEDMGNTGWKARLLNNLALLYHMTGQLEKSFPLLEESLVTAERSGYSWLHTSVLISLGDLHTDLGDFASARDHYDRALTAATTLGDSLLIFYASLGEARLKHLIGEILPALDDLKRVEITQINLGRYERALFNIEAGSCFLKCARVDEAIDVLKSAVEYLDQGSNQMEQAGARLWLALALHEKDPEAATVELEKMLPPAAEWQKPTPLMLHAGRAGRWLRTRKHLPFENPQIIDFFRQAEKILNSMPALALGLSQPAKQAIPALPSLKILTFGNVRVFINNRELLLSDWQTREARELFIFFLDSPPMTKEQIALKFWPDISPARLKMRFKINVHRIRKAVGQNAIIFEGEHYRFNRNMTYSWDREEFDKVLQKIANAPEKVHLMEQAAALITGPYLADVSADWAIPESLRYQDTYHQLMVELAEYYLKDGQPQECLRVARQVLQSEPLLETAHRLIIQAYAALHDPARMLLQYQEYEKMLEREMGLQPSSEIIALYEALLRKV